jgi:hypothetical protein
VAVRVTGVAPLTVPEVTENVTEVKPCGTVTVVSTLADAALELESDTIAPPVPAGPVRVTVPVPDWPLTIVPGLTEILFKAAGGGLTVRPKVLITPA